jgi:hypothetical protein
LKLVENQVNSCIDYENAVGFSFEDLTMGEQSFLAYFRQKIFPILVLYVGILSDPGVYPKQSVDYLPEFGITRSLMGGTSFV